MLDITNIPPPRVPVIDERTGLMTREWYRFLLSLFRLSGSGSNDITLQDLQLSPQAQVDFGDLNYAYDQAQLASLMTQYEQSIVNVTKELQTLPSDPQLGTLASQNADNVRLIGFSTNPSPAIPNPAPTGTLYWDGNSTLGLQMNQNVLAKIGQAQFVYVKASSAITKGQLCKHTGSVGTSGVITAAPTSTSMTDAAQIIGVAAESIALNGFGFIQVTGDLRGFNTTGSSVGEVWADGDALYYNPAYVGSMTKVKPSAPNIKTHIGEVINAGSGSSGSINIQIVYGSSLGGTDNNVQFGTLSNNDLIQYDSTAQYWKNVSPSTISIGTATNLANGLAGSVPYQSAPSTTTFLSIGASNYVLTSTGTAPTWTANTGSGNVVRATSPALVTPLLGTPTSGDFSTGTFTWPTFNQNTTGTAAGLSATLIATSGGTGQSSYAVGDLLYASTTTALSKLADVATGNALISGGVGVAPSYGKIGLTTHVSGTLPVANGGTGTTTAFTTGSVLFAGASGVYSQDNAQFFWDDTNNRLGIGTSAPAAKLQVFGGTDTTFVPNVYNTRLTGDASATSGNSGSGISFQGYTTGTTSISDLAFVSGIKENTTDTNYAGALVFGTRTTGSGGGNFERMRVTSAGNVGIRTTTPSTKLDVKNTTTGSAIRATVTDGAGSSDFGYGFYIDNTAHEIAAVNAVYTTSSSGGSGALTFKYRNAGTLTEGMRLNQLGNVGIGTPSPSAKLDVNGDAVLLRASVATNSYSGTTLSSSIPAKFYAGLGLYTDTASAASSTNTLAPLSSFRAGSIAATNTAVTYIDAANIYISGPPIASTNVTFTNAYALFINSGQFRFPGDTRKSIVTTYNDATGDVYGMEQVSSAQSGTNAALRLFCSSSASSVIAFGKYTSATAFTEFGRFDNNGQLGINTSSNLSTLTVNGSFASKSPSSVNAATYTVATTDGSLRFTTTNCTVTLPAAASFPGRILYLNTITANSVTSASSNVIPLGSNTAGTAILAATAGKFSMLQSDGTNWITMMSN